MKNILINNVKSITCPFSSNNSGGRRINRANHALIFKFEGETIYNSNNKIIISNAENIVFLPKGCDYIWKSKKEGHFYSIEFEGEIDETEIKIFKYPYKDKILKIFSNFEHDVLKNNELKKFLKVKFWQVLSKKKLRQRPNYFSLILIFTFLVFGVYVSFKSSPLTFTSTECSPTP